MVRFSLLCWTLLKSLDYVKSWQDFLWWTLWRRLFSCSFGCWIAQHLPKATSPKPLSLTQVSVREGELGLLRAGFRIRLSRQRPSLGEVNDACPSENRGYFKKSSHQWQVTSWHNVAFGAIYFWASTWGHCFACHFLQHYPAKVMGHCDESKPFAD